MLGLGIRRAVGAYRASGWAAGKYLGRGVSGAAASDRDVRVEYLQDEFSGATVMMMLINYTESIYSV